MHRSVYYYWKKAISVDSIKALNKKIKKNFISVGRDYPAVRSSKTSRVKRIVYGVVKDMIKPCIERGLSANENIWGFNLYPLVDDKVLNYNMYRPQTEYSWHVDVNRNANHDMKLTMLINLSEGRYTGGKFELFEGSCIEVEEFSGPGDVVIFPSYINHRVTPLRSGTRNTLTVWFNGPRWR